MKRCPECRRDYYDDSLMYCLDDGVHLVEGPSTEEPATEILSESPVVMGGSAATGERPTSNQILTTDPAAMPHGRSIPRLDKRFWAILLFLTIIGAGIWYFGREWFAPSAASVTEVTYQPLTFEEGFIFAARFAPDGRTVVYSADWKGQPRGIYVTSLYSDEFRSLGFEGADVLGISHTGEIAILTGSTVQWGNPYLRAGTLARTSMTGSAPRPQLDDVWFADFGPNNTMAVIRRKEGRGWILEYPAGQVLAEGELVDPRVSPNGEHIAYFETGQGGARLKLIDRSGRLLVESPWFSDWCGLAWRSPSELWFAVQESRADTSIYSIDTSVRQRKVYTAPGVVTLHDISPQGDVLISFERGTPNIEVLETADAEPQDRSFRGSSRLKGFANDRTLLIDVFGAPEAVYVRRANDPKVVKIADGLALGLSRDGTKALVQTSGDPLMMSIVPTGAGQSIPVDLGPIESVSGAGWLPDGRLIINVSVPGVGPSAYIVSATGRDPRTFLPEGVRILAANLISSDGTHIVGIDGPGNVLLCTIDIPGCRPLSSMQRGDAVAGWGADGKTLYVFTRLVETAQIDRVDINSGRRSPWKTVRPLNPAANGITRFYVAPDGAVAYWYQRAASQLYVIKGLR